MQENPYRPPTVRVEDAISPESPALHGSASILLATFVGGPFAAAYLVRSNFARRNLASSARWHVLALALFGAIALYLAVDAPPDLISRSILSVPFSLISVWLYLSFLNRRWPEGQVRRKRSIWYGVAAGILARLVIVGLLALSAGIVEAVRDSSVA